MTKRIFIVLAWLALGLPPLSWLIARITTASVAQTAPGADNQSFNFSGSVSCRECHDRFYRLWAPSHHGLAMQPYTPLFAKANLTPLGESIKIGSFSYRVEIDADSGMVIEQGPEGEKRYEMIHVLGGKNVYYFLTNFQRGRLQTLPLAYDVHKQQWFDTAASGVRNFSGMDRDDPVHWTDPLYTFNTSCYNCHVSQLTNIYDLKTDSYHTRWTEPGINCETCHGPSENHVRMYRQARETGEEPDDLGLISTRTFSAEQTNSMCNSCHAKTAPITASFMPGEKYFDHFDLVALENIDFYPDGRDLGENYTATGWRMSACARAGELDCIHCHTSSGRYRFKDPIKANEACLPCHQSRVDTVAAHSHHEQGDEAPGCVSCHMPMTRFAHMNRTDHSMRAPVPAATIKYKSENACNLCHQGQDEDAAWAQAQVTKWGMTTRQEQYLLLADYVDRARNQDWEPLDGILAYVLQEDRDEIVAGSLIRLLRGCDSDKKWPVLIKVLENDPSPFVRATAAEALDSYLTGESLKALLKATNDEFRLVRVRAAASLASLPPGRLRDDLQQSLDRAMAELIAGLTARSDDYVSHYNLGNVYLAQRRLDQALTSYQTSMRLRPDFVPPHVNAAFIYNAQGQNENAEQSFRQALALEPDNVITQTNLAMLLAEMGRSGEAEKTFLKVLSIDSDSANAAFNLGVMLADARPQEAIIWTRKAHELRPDNPRYAYTYAFYLRAQGDLIGAIMVLRKIVEERIPYPDAYMLLGDLLEMQGETEKARQVYEEGAGIAAMPEPDRRYLQMQAGRLER